jgi:hypothetical protein
MDVEELCAREAIRDVIARYNHAGDRGRLAELACCFTPDGELVIGDDPPLSGRAAIEAHLVGVVRRVAASSQRVSMRHHVSSVVIELADREHATAFSYFCVFTEIGLDHWGRYADRLVKRGDEWLIASRRVRTDGAAPGSRVVA